VPPCPSAVQTSVEQDSDMRRPQAALLVNGRRFRCLAVAVDQALIRVMGRWWGPYE
jgi:hypothetical protein